MKISFKKTDGVNYVAAQTQSCVNSSSFTPNLLSNSQKTTQTLCSGSRSGMTSSAGRFLFVWRNPDSGSHRTRSLVNMNVFCVVRPLAERAAPMGLGLLAFAHMVFCFNGGKRVIFISPQAGRPQTSWERQMNTGRGREPGWDGLVHVTFNLRRFQL